MTDHFLFHVKECEAVMGRCHLGELKTTSWLFPSVLADARLTAPFEQALTSQVLPIALSGRMPLCLVSGLVAWLVRLANSPPSIWLFEPRLANYVPVWPTSVCRNWLSQMQVSQLPTELFQEKNPEYSRHLAEKAYPDVGWPLAAEVVQVRTPPREQLGFPAIIHAKPALEQLLADCSRSLLALDGPMPLWLAAAIAGELTSWPSLEVLAVHAPAEGGFVVVQGNPQVPVGTVIPRRQPLLVAIIGDPQHGKSVLSWKLYWQLQERKVLRVYRLDADAYSPTPGWSLNPLTKPIRDEYKRVRGPWSDKDHETLANALRNLKRTMLDLVLVDLPGGDHSCQPPLRVPPSREKVFQAVDKFILVYCDGSCGKYPDCRSGWHQALRNLGLIGALAAEVISVLDASEELPGVSNKPNVSSSQKDGELALLPRWRVSKLQRQPVRETTFAIEDLSQFILRLTRPYDLATS
ncbi:MAG: hypothetical protein RMI91_10570 [Gemmatales bacterium]|nr:hypothetical protein [Gemmatales bacterium]